MLLRSVDEIVEYIRRVSSSAPQQFALGKKAKDSQLQLVHWVDGGEMDEDGWWLACSLTGMVAAVCRSDATAGNDVWMGIRNVAQELMHRAHFSFKNGTQKTSPSPRCVAHLWPAMHVEVEL